MDESIEMTTREVAHRWFDALDQGDFPAAIACLADDIYWVNLPKVEGVSDIIPWLGTCYGVAEVVNSFETRNAVCEVRVFKPHELCVEGDQAFGTVNDVAVIKVNGQVFDTTFATWMQVADGKIVRWKSYCDPSPIIAAFKFGANDRLIAAVKAGDKPGAQLALTQYASPDSRDSATGLTVLMMAACQANTELVTLLLEHGADVLTTDSKTGATALHKCAQGGSVEIAELLVARGAFLDATTPTMGHTPVMDALWYKWPDLVAYLCKAGANLKLDTHYGFTLEDHLRFETNVNSLGKERMAAITETIHARERADTATIAEQTVMAAANAGDAGKVKQLLAAAASVNTVHPHINSFLDGHTPLLVAARDGHTEIVKDLLAAGATVRVEDWVFKGAPIHKATYNGNPEILKMLIAAPTVDLNVQGAINGYTPLHDALWHGYAECALLLLDAGARLDLRGHDGKSCLDIAENVFGKDHAVPQAIRANINHAAAA